MRLNIPVAMLLATGLASGCAQSMRPDMGSREADGASPTSSAVDSVQVLFNTRPTTWFAGPDPSSWPVSTDGSGGRSVVVMDWDRFLTVPAWPPDGRAYFGPDSFRYIPVTRRPVTDNIERRTFYEIYGNRIYARSEGEEVHLDSWVVFCLGGSDRDSPYIPHVDPSDPALPPGYAGDPVAYAALNDLGFVRSPVGFRHRIAIRMPNGNIVQGASSSLYPVYDPNSVFRNPVLMGYQRMIFSGKVYAAIGAEDAGGLRDDAAFADMVGIADRVDGGGGTFADRLARRKIVVFNVGQ
jgi:hypothetical protein